jgi:hypothetical protein
MIEAGSKVLRENRPPARVEQLRERNGTILASTTCTSTRATTRRRTAPPIAGDRDQDAHLAAAPDDLDRRARHRELAQKA